MLFLLPHNPLLHLSALGLNRHSDEAEEGGKTQRIYKINADILIINTAFISRNTLNQNN